MQDVVRLLVAVGGLLGGGRFLLLQQLLAPGLELLVDLPAPDLLSESLSFGANHKNYIIEIIIGPKIIAAAPAPDMAVTGL